MLITQAWWQNASLTSTATTNLALPTLHMQTVQTNDTILTDRGPIYVHIPDYLERERFSVVSNTIVSCGAGMWIRTKTHTRTQTDPDTETFSCPPAERANWQQEQRCVGSVMQFVFQLGGWYGDKSSHWLLLLLLLPMPRILPSLPVPTPTSKSEIGARRVSERTGHKVLFTRFRFEKNLWPIKDFIQLIKENAAIAALVSMSVPMIACVCECAVFTPLSFCIREREEKKTQSDWEWCGGKVYNLWHSINHSHM